MVAPNGAKAVVPQRVCVLGCVLLLRGHLAFLETFLFVTAGERGFFVSWHLVSRSQLHYRTSYNVWDLPLRQRSVQPQMSVVPKLMYRMCYIESRIIEQKG